MFWLLASVVTLLYLSYLYLSHKQPIMDPDINLSRQNSNTDQLRDIYHTAFLLRQKLVPDVVPAILQHAGLFQRHTYSNDSLKHPRVITQNSAPHPCLTTPAIQSSARVQNPVRKVVFCIQSSDQGWANNRDAGSWTWFTAGVQPKNPDIASPTQVSEILDMALKDDPVDKFLTREREIYRNDVASSEMKTHIVEWSADSDDQEERKWIEALENGDRIAVRAWAQFSGWQNHVKYASVAIYTTAVI